MKVNLKVFTLLKIVFSIQISLVKVGNSYFQRLSTRDYFNVIHNIQSSCVSAKPSDRVVKAEKKTSYPKKAGRGRYNYYFLFPIILNFLK